MGLARLWLTVGVQQMFVELRDSKVTWGTERRGTLGWRAGPGRGWESSRLEGLKGDRCPPPYDGESEEQKRMG